MPVLFYACFINYVYISGPYAGLCLGGFFTKLRWTFPEGEARIHSYSVRNALLEPEGSGGMPPPGKFWILGFLRLILVQFRDKLAMKLATLQHYNTLLIDLERTFLPQFWPVGGGSSEPPEPPLRTGLPRSFFSLDK